MVIPMEIWAKAAPAARNSKASNLFLTSKILADPQWDRK